MTPDELARMIPPEVVEATARAICKSMQSDWDDPDTYRYMFLEDARAALAAGLAAWPNLKLDPSWDLRTHKRRVALILPLPEATNDKGDANV